MTQKIVSRKGLKFVSLLFLVPILVVSFSPLAQAALVIDSFSCNSQTTTTSVESGEAMSCTAAILNNDLQNAASANQVSLVPSGSWAEQSSYAVSLNTNIGAGQSKTVTFSNIRSTTPGDTHKFLHIDIDGTAHTEAVESLSVNAVSLKSVSFSSTASSVSTSGTFDLSTTVITGGSYADVTVSVSLSGCSFRNNDISSKSIGSMGNNAQATRSWAVTQGSSSCTATLTATGTSTPVTSTKTKTATVSNPSAGSDTGSSSSSSGGGGGGGGSNATTANQTTAPVASQPQATVPTAEAPAASPIETIAREVSKFIEAVTSAPENTLLIVLVVVLAVLGGLAFLKFRH